MIRAAAFVRGGWRIGGTGFAGRLSPAPARRGAIPAWAMYAGLFAMMAVTLQLGLLGIGATRILFVACCVIASWLAWRSSDAQHLETIIVLFAFAPFLRRVVDLNAGFEPTGYMLTGPMLAIIVPLIELRGLLGKHEKLHPGAVAYVVHGLCIGYAAMLTLFQGEILVAASVTLKWLAPLLYGLWLLHKADEGDHLVRAAARAFAIVIPLMGIYGAVQYVDPPAWDRYWMVYAQMTSIGQPVPYQVRVFSTMNSPASYATFAVGGLLLFGFTRPVWQALLLALPTSLGLLLSLYRTAWLALAAGVMFTLLFARTRRRAGVILIALTIAASLAAVTTPFGEVIAERIATFTQPSEDGSGQERIGEYVTLYNKGASTLTGEGFSTIDVGSPGTMPVDGQIVACWLSMGLMVGLVSLAAIVWVGVQALAQVWRRPDPFQVTLGAIVIGCLMQLPLAGIATSELGVLFWMAAAIATSRSGRPAGAKLR